MYWGYLKWDLVTSLKWLYGRGWDFHDLWIGFLHVQSFLKLLWLGFPRHPKKNFKNFYGPGFLGRVETLSLDCLHLIALSIFDHLGYFKGLCGLGKIPDLEKSLDFTFWFSISPELDQRTQEVIHKKYGGREKAEKAALIIQESYRQYRLRQSFHKLR